LRSFEVRAVLGPVCVHTPLLKIFDELYEVHVSSLKLVSFADTEPLASTRQEYDVPLWHAPIL